MTARGLDLVIDETSLNHSLAQYRRARLVLDWLRQQKEYPPDPVCITEEFTAWILEIDMRLLREELLSEGGPDLYDFHEIPSIDRVLATLGFCGEPEPLELAIYRIISVAEHVGIAEIVEWLEGNQRA